MTAAIAPVGVYATPVAIWSPVLVPDSVPPVETVRVCPSAIVSVEPVAGCVIATLLIDVATATPRVGVTKVGDVFITKILPVPV